jgi:DNA-binding GntR family transcriptional regulator
MHNYFCYKITANFLLDVIMNYVLDIVNDALREGGLVSDETNKVVDLASRALQRRPLHEHIVEILREMVLEGQLKPGERVLELELCRKLNVSRTPMREALKVLAAEHLVELQQSRGAVVTGIRIEEVVEHFEVLEALDATIGALAAARITDEELREVEALHRGMVEHHHAGRRSKYFEANQAVHTKLAAVTRNKSLAATHLQYSRKIARVRYSANFSQIRWDESVEEHEKIIVALRQRDASTLSALMREHMRATARSVIAALEQEPVRREAQK